MKALEERIFKSPEDESLWHEYISALEKESPSRAEILKLSRSELSAENLIRLGWLIHSEPDKLWIAQFETFRGIIKKFREMEIPVTHYGGAPSRYGKGVYKLGHQQLFFFLRIGWEWIGQGNNYYYAKPPSDWTSRRKRTVIPMLVPEQDELKKLEGQFDLSNKAPKSIQHRTFGFWDADYRCGGWRKPRISKSVTISQDGISHTEEKKDGLVYEEKSLWLSFPPFLMGFKWSESAEETYHEYITEY